MIVGFCILIIVAYTIQTAFGFAGTAIVMPFLIMLIGKDLAVGIMGLLGFFACIVVAIHERQYIQYKIAGKTVSVVLVGMLLGTYLQQILEDYMVIFYGITIIIISTIMFFTGGKMKINFWMGKGILIIAGIMHAAFVCGGPMLVFYTMNQIKDKSKFRATMSLMWVGTNILLIIQHLQGGIYTYQMLQYSLIGSIMLVIGIILGNKLHQIVIQEKFIKVGSVLLILSGICMMV